MDTPYNIMKVLEARRMRNGSGCSYGELTKVIEAPLSEIAREINILAQCSAIIIRGNGEYVINEQRKDALPDED